MVASPIVLFNTTEPVRLLPTLVRAMLPAEVSVITPPISTIAPVWLMDVALVSFAVRVIRVL
jgi:hypothetical protein